MFLVIFINIDVPYLNYKEHYLMNNLFNVNLLNGIFYIHPAFVIISYILLIKLSISLFYIKNKINIFKINYKNINIIVNILLFFSIILGSYWSQQEQN